MPWITNTPPTYTDRASAERRAAELNAAEVDGWTYRADHPPAGQPGYSTVSA